ncbi:MAG: hypothetical protein HWN65_12890 [Candidatus Helarchaeota archaeon]|nr:hypothetical protein [Candidatus Helarchaeota archaeon]
MDLKYIVIDSTIGRNEEDLKILEEISTNGTFDDKNLLLLQFTKANGKVKNLLDSFSNLKIIELENKANSSDIKSIFQHFSEIEGKTVDTFKDKIKLGKKILYLDAVSNSFIRRFESNQECPGFWNLAIGTFCRHGCTYCFLNLTMRIRPLCIEHVNLSRLKNNLKHFNKKHGHINALLNADETSDPLDNEPMLHLWNKIVEIVRDSGNQLLCLTKSNNVRTIPESDGGKLADSVIYSWSINPKPIVHRYEPLTASSEERLSAAKKLKNFGYRIRFRVDPILPVQFMKDLSNGKDLSVKDIDLEEYFLLIDKFSEIGPEMVTFGTFRALPPLFNFLLDKTFKKQHLRKNGKRFRIPEKFRHYIYEQLGNYTHNLLGCNIAICKDPTIKLNFSTLKVPCQCIKLSD